MKPMCMPSTTLVEFDCKIAALIEAPKAVSAEDAFYPRASADCEIKRTPPAPFFRDQTEEQALRIAALRMSPRLPGISWMYGA